MPTTYKPTNVAQYSSDALNLAGKSIRLTAAAKADIGDADVVTIVDYAVPYDCIMQGGSFLSVGATLDDGFTIAVVDVDGIIAPAGTVLLTPYDNWAPNSHIFVETPYPAKLYQGLYIRLSYRNTQITTVNVVLNIPFNKVLF